MAKILKMSEWILKMICSGLIMLIALICDFDISFPKLLLVEYNEM